jgi:hypothetical protein
MADDDSDWEEYNDWAGTKVDGLPPVAAAPVRVRLQPVAVQARPQPVAVLAGEDESDWDEYDSWDGQTIPGINA